MTERIKCPKCGLDIILGDIDLDGGTLISQTVRCPNPECDCSIGHMPGGEPHIVWDPEVDGD